MKSNFQDRFKKQVLKNIFVSGVITGVVEFFLVMNFSIIGRILEIRNYYNNTRLQSRYASLIAAMVLVFIGIVIFSISGTKILEYGRIARALSLARAAFKIS